MSKTPPRILILVGTVCGSLIAGVTLGQLDQAKTIAQTSTSPTPTVTVVSCQEPTQMPRVRTIFPGDVEFIPDGGSGRRAIRVPSFHQDCTLGNSGNNLRAYVEPRPMFTFRRAGGEHYTDRVRMYRTGDPDQRILVEWDCRAVNGYETQLETEDSFVKAEIRYYCCNNCN